MDDDIHEVLSPKSLKKHGYMYENFLEQKDLNKIIYYLICPSMHEICQQNEGSQVRQQYLFSVNKTSKQNLIVRPLKIIILVINMWISWESRFTIEENEIVIDDEVRQIKL